MLVERATLEWAVSAVVKAWMETEASPTQWLGQWLVWHQRRMAPPPTAHVGATGL